MKYKISLPDGTAQRIQITSAYFKAWHVWNIKFEDGKAVMLFKMGNDWLQRNQDYLDAQMVNLLGVLIDKIILRRKLNII